MNAQIISLKSQSVIDTMTLQCECCQNIIQKSTKYSVIVNDRPDGTTHCEIICGNCVAVDQIVKTKKLEKQLERLANNLRETFSWKKLPDALTYRIMEYLDINTRNSLVSQYELRRQEDLDYFQRKFIEIGRMQKPSWRASVLSILRGNHIVMQSWVNSVKSYETKIKDIFFVRPLHWDRINKRTNTMAEYGRLLIWRSRKWFGLFEHRIIMRQQPVIMVFTLRGVNVKDI